MPQNKITILSTKEIDQATINDAAGRNIIVDVSSFIKTEPIRSIELQQGIEHAFLQSVSVVFTSKNAVESVAAKQKGHQPDWTIYCIGNTTKQLVEKYFGENHIAGSA